MAEGQDNLTVQLAGDVLVIGFLQASINGLLQGGLLALVAVGFSLVWGVMNVVNLAHGAFVIIGCYLTWEANASWGLDPLVALFLAAASLFTVGYLVQRFLVNLVVNAPIFITLLLTFGLNLMLIQGMNILFTANYRGVSTSYSTDSLSIGALRVPVGRLIAFGVAAVVTLVLVLVMNRTRIGMAITATGMDRGAARLMGIKAGHVYAVTFGIAAALAGVAGAMVATVGTFQPADGAKYTLLSFVIAVLGGLGNMYGAMVGGLVIGLVEAWAGYLLAGTWVNAIAFLVLVVVLMLRPAGLIGRQYYAVRLEV